MQYTTEYRWDGRILDHSLEKEYGHETIASDFKTIRIACLVTVIAYLLGAIANYQTFGWSSPFIIITCVRAAALLAALSGIYSTVRTSSRSLVDRLVFLYFTLLVLGDSLELSLTPAKALPELPGLIVIVLIYYMFYPSRLIFMITGGLLAGVSYCLTAALVHGAGDNLFANSVISFLLINGFGIYHVRNMNRMHRTKFLALRSVEVVNTRLEDEIVERKKIQQKLFEQATTDELTNVYNRRFFMELAEKEFSRSRRHQYPLSLIMIDLDHFKAVNDNYGHDMGDLVLRTLSDRARETIRNEDVLGRLGGEEFAVLMPDTDESAAVTVAERIRKAIEIEPVRRNGTSVRVTASFGVKTGRPGRDDNLADWLRLVDEALYTAKNNGRNQVVEA